MSESNGTATRNRVSEVFPKSNGSAPERGERNGHASGRQRAGHEGRTTLSLGLGSRVRRIAMGVAAAVVLIAGVGFAVIANSETEAETPAAPRVLAVQTIVVESVSAYQVATSTRARLSPAAQANLALSWPENLNSFTSTKEIPSPRVRLLPSSTPSTSRPGGFRWSPSERKPRRNSMKW